MLITLLSECLVPVWYGVIKTCMHSNYSKFSIASFQPSPFVFLEYIARYQTVCKSECQIHRLELWCTFFSASISSLDHTVLKWDHKQSAHELLRPGEMLCQMPQWHFSSKAPAKDYRRRRTTWTKPSCCLLMKSSCFFIAPCRRNASSKRIISLHNANITRKFN